MRALWLALAVLAASGGLAAAQPRGAAATCDGYPRLDIGMAPGMCAGLTADGRSGGPRMPRVLLSEGGHAWLVTDLGDWADGRGGVWRLEAAPGERARWTRLLGGLTTPHAIARGPDGTVLVGEMSRIIRFDATVVDPAATIEVVVSGLPDNRLHENRHPLSMFVFDGNGDLIVNVGAPSDQCPPAAGARTCTETEETAGLRRYRYVGDGRWAGDYTMEAQGLRNSLALARHRSGTLLQAENSIDFATRFLPFEELNVIEAGRSYGWPYCTDMRTPTPLWRGRAQGCGEAYTPPALLLPPHAAPLSMLYYDGAMFPQLRGRLLMSWHGHRSTGGRVVAYDVDDRGVPQVGAGARYPLYPSGSRAYPAGAPAAEALVLTPGWGGRPQGSPVGLAVAEDGAIWVADDRNRRIIRIAADGG